MIQKKIYLYENNDRVYMDVFLCDDAVEYSHHTRPFLLVCPGGGYGFLSAREAEPIARRYMGYGFNTAILHYTIAGDPDGMTDKLSGLPKPLIEVAKSTSIIRENASEWNTDGEKIAVVGFSAGGHLAGSSGVFAQKPELIERIGNNNNRPNAMVLAYPVITGVGASHPGSFKNLLDSPTPSQEKLAEYSLEKNVTPNCPPTFIFHTFEDKTVPVSNAICMAEALANNNVYFEAHILPYGNHGLSLASGEVLVQENAYATRWVDWSVEWLKKTLNIFNA